MAYKIPFGFSLTPFFHSAWSIYNFFAGCLSHHLPPVARRLIFFFAHFFFHLCTPQIRLIRNCCSHEWDGTSYSLSFFRSVLTILSLTSTVQSLYLFKFRWASCKFKWTENSSGRMICDPPATCFLFRLSFEFMAARLELENYSTVEWLFSNLFFFLLLWILFFLYPLLLSPNLLFLSPFSSFWISYFNSFSPPLSQGLIKLFPIRFNFSPQHRDHRNCSCLNGSSWGLLRYAFWSGGLLPYYKFPCNKNGR